jgi:hypothetical protein
MPTKAELELAEKGIAKRIVQRNPPPLVEADPASMKLSLEHFTPAKAFVAVLDT